MEEVHLYVGMKGTNVHKKTTIDIASTTLDTFFCRIWRSIYRVGAVTRKVDREKSGPVGQVLASKLGPPGPPKSGFIHEKWTYAAKSGSTI